MQIKRILTAATAIAATLALSLGISASAMAATDEFRPGTSSPSSSGNSSWQPTLYDTSAIAQPFTQLETGQVHSFTFEINDEETGNLFASAALHTFDNETGPSADPIAGGLAQISLDAPVNGKIDALLTFPDRPTLIEGERYAVVMNPLASADPAISASFSYFLDWTGSSRDFFAWELLNGQWKGAGTSYMIFSSQLVSAFATPEAPTLDAAECGVVPGVVLPETEGVSYDVQQDGMSWVVTAEAAEGYELAAESTTSWTLDFTVSACTIVSIDPVDPVDPVDPIDPVDPENTDKPVEEDKPGKTEKDEDKLVVQQKPAAPKDTLADTGISVTVPITVSLGLLLLGAGAFVATRLARVN